MKVKTSELSGVQLDVAVALALGGEITRPQDAQVYLNGMHQLCGEANKRHSRYVFSPSTDWSQCGPLRDEFNVGIEPGSASDGRRYAYVPGRELDGSFGETALIAICRAVVSAKLGYEVEIPDELMEVKG